MHIQSHMLCNRMYGLREGAIHVYVCIHIFLFVESLVEHYAYHCTILYIYICVYMRKAVCTTAHVCIYIYVYTFTSMQTYIRTSIYIYM